MLPHPEAVGIMCVSQCMCIVVGQHEQFIVYHRSLPCIATIESEFPNGNEVFKVKVKGSPSQGLFPLLGSQKEERGEGGNGREAVKRRESNSARITPDKKPEQTPRFRVSFQAIE
jgi:hypothetical protein